MAIFGIQIFKRFRITRKLPGKRQLLENEIQY